MRTYLIAVAAGSLAGALVAATAGAQPASGQFYGKAFGGFTIPQNDDFTLGAKAPAVGSVATGLDYDTGYTAGLAAGYQFTPSLAFEVEYAYRNADADLKRLATSGTVRSNAFMANAIYSFPAMGQTGAWRPYVGFGIGAADAKYDPDGFGSFDSDYNFAYQAITGVSYDITPQWSLNGEVRFFGINDQTYENDDASFKTPFHTFDALVGATYHF